MNQPPQHPDDPHAWAQPPTDPAPMARPVASDLSADQPYLRYASPIDLAESRAHPPAGMSRLRAGLELLALLPTAFLGVFFVAFITRGFDPADQRWIQVVDSITLGLFLAFVCVLLALLGGDGLRSIGLTGRHAGRNILIGLAALAGTYFVLFQAAFLLMLLFPEMMTDKPEAQKAIEQTFPAMSLLMVVLVNAVVVAWEELVFRGFILTRLQALVNRWWLSVPLAAIVFGSLHGYEGPLAMVLIGLLGVVMGVLFAWRKSLVPGAAYHLANNVLVFQLFKVV